MFPFTIFVAMFREKFIQIQKIYFHCHNLDIILLFNTQQIKTVITVYQY